jgi:hypothetical protein
MSSLRKIALTVEQDDPGHFHWLIIESIDENLLYDKEVIHGEEAYADYGSAWEAGLKAIRQHFANDLADGPKAEGGAQAGSPVAESEIVWSPS